MNKEFNSLVVATFNTQSGEKLLKLLTKYYLLDTPVAPHYRTDSYAYFREGENKLVRLFNNIMLGDVK